MNKYAVYGPWHCATCAITCFGENRDRREVRSLVAGFVQWLPVLNWNEGRKDTVTGRRVRVHLRSTNKDSRKERSRLEAADFRAWEAPWRAIWNDQNVSHLMRIWPHRAGTTREKSKLVWTALSYTWLALCKMSLERNRHKYVRKSDNAKCTKWSDNFNGTEEVQ